MTTFWAYAIVDRAPPSALAPEGAFEGAPLESATGDGFAVVGATLSAPPAPEIDALRAHDRVVRAIAADVGAILPLRFGTLTPTGAELARSIGARAEFVREGLERVRGAQQITLRLRGGVSEPDDPEVEGEGPGTRWLKKRARERHPKIAGWEESARELRAIAREERVQRGDVRFERWRVYHLIASTDLRRYGEAAARTRASAADFGIVIGESAPPWAFVPEELT